MQNIKKSLNNQGIVKTPGLLVTESRIATGLQPVAFGNESPQTSTSANKAPLINYKNIVLLQRFMSEQGKIISRKITGIGAKEQRKISKAIKHARIMGMLPFISVK
jgi:small subunit ribosomal protein S18